MAFFVRDTMIFWRAPVAQYLRLHPSGFSVGLTSPLWFTGRKTPIIYLLAHLALSSWPLRPALGAQGIVFWGSHLVARAYSGPCSLMIPSTDT